MPWTPEQRAARGSNFARMADDEGLEHGVRTHWYDSAPAHEAAEWAAEHGQADAFRHQVFRMYFVANRNIASPDVLAEIATEVGLDPADLRAALQEGRYRERIQAQFEEARAVGVTAVPTFVADDRYAIVGAHPYENFERLMTAVGREPR